MALTRPSNQSTYIPTLSKLGVTNPGALSLEEVERIAEDWLERFPLGTKNVTSNDQEGHTLLLGLFLPDRPEHPPFWRDLLAFNSDLRTFIGGRSILAFIKNAAHLICQAYDFRLQPTTARLVRPYPDFVWIQAIFKFTTQIGHCSGVVRLVPVLAGSSTKWAAHIVLTSLDDLRGFPESIGRLRNHQPQHPMWKALRKQEVDFENRSPQVVIIGGGNIGLTMAARLKSIGVDALVVDKNPRIGDTWRNRYEGLCLHNSVWYDHLPYLPFPSTWPVFTPAHKFADWLESYAQHLDLNIWLSSIVLSASPSSLEKGCKQRWTIRIKRPDGSIRTFLDVPHIIFATGFAADRPKIPQVEGMEIFKGEVCHSSEHRSPVGSAGKRVLIVGGANSALDIAGGFALSGADVHVLQRSSTHIISVQAKLNQERTLYSDDAPKTEDADLLGAALPFSFMIKGLAQRARQDAAEYDKEMLDGLRKAGFKLNDGIDDTGFLLLAWERGGGYYYDPGYAQLIIDGKIKIKSNCTVERLKESHVTFSDESEERFDIVIFATGFDMSGYNEAVRQLCGDLVAQRCKPIWGLDEEGELKGVWRDVGVSGLWYAFGALGQARFYSKHLAIQIKASIENISLD